MNTEALKSAKSRVVGWRQTVKQLQRGTAVTVFVARDAEARMRRELEQLCAKNQVPVEYVETMAELGRLCGIDVGAACCAVTSVEQNGWKGGPKHADH